MITILTEFGAEQLSARMQASVKNAQRATPVMSEIAVDMVRVTDLLWKSQGRRGGVAWKKLAESTVKAKGSSRILYTAGSNPSYTRHPGEDVLANSVTQVGGAHQILKVDRTSVLFGTNLEYGGKIFGERPFIRFTPGDMTRWNEMIGGYIVRPFIHPTNPNLSRSRGFGGRFTGRL